MRFFIAFVLMVAGIVLFFLNPKIKLNSSGAWANYHALLYILSVIIFLVGVLYFLGFW